MGKRRPGGVYRVGPFNNVTASGRFALYPKATTCNVDTGNAGVRLVGNILLIAGTAVLIADGTAALAADTVDLRVASLVSAEGTRAA